MIDIITQDRLADVGCSNPNCDHDHSKLFLNAKCHPKSGLEAMYEKQTGLLHLNCLECGQPLASVVVARSN